MKNLCVVALVAGMSGLAFASAARAEDAAAVPFDCADGTSLSISFGETDATLALADGQTVTLKQIESGSGFHYSSGKHDIVGKGDEIQYAIGKKAAVTCQARAAGVEPFDEPVTVDEVPLKADPANPDVERRITCYRYPEFAVKEVDYGEKGAQKLALIAKDAACQEEDAKERIIPDLEGYFLGVLGKYVFFTYSDGWNGGMPFQVYDSTTLKLLFEDSFAGDNIQSAELTEKGFVLGFDRVYSAECSLYLDGGTCPDQIKAAVPGLGTVAKIPDCGPAYEEEKKRTPDYAKEVEQAPSVIVHKAKLEWDGQSAKVQALEGETSCHMPT